MNYCIQLLKQNYINKCKELIILYMVILISYALTVFSLIFLIITLVLGYINPTKHVPYAFSTIILYSFTQTFIMFYFIGSGKKIKEMIIEYKLNKGSYEKVLLMKRILFPHITYNILFIGAAFILGGAVHTLNISKWWHSITFFIGILHYLKQMIIQHDCFLEDRIILEDLWLEIDSNKNISKD